MDDKFNTAEEARAIANVLRKQLKQLPYNNDLHRLELNIGLMITRLSALEVDVRRTRKTYKFDSYKQEVVKAITHLQHLMLIAKLMA